MARTLVASENLSSTVIAGTGPSLTRAVAEQCRNVPVVAVHNAVELFPWALAVVAKDASWWRGNASLVSDYRGDCILPVHYPSPPHRGVTTLQSSESDRFLPFNAGRCSGFAAISYALHLSYKRLVLVGFDMRIVGGRRHFYDEHPDNDMHSMNPARYMADFERAAALLPPDVEILNATPGSALKCFPFANLEDALCDERARVGCEPPGRPVLR